MSDFSIGFGMRLKEERERMSLNQADFGALAGVGKLAQLNYEKGDRSPSAEYLHSIANHGVDVGYLLTGQKADIENEPEFVDRALLEEVLHANAKTVNRYGFKPLPPGDFARLAVAVYGRIAADKSRNVPSTIQEVSELAFELLMLP